MHPSMEADGGWILSPNGKYVCRLNFNGTFRRVEIDDRLPVSKTRRVIHVIDRNNPSLLWPALLEKSYLKVRGGYDFPGSNSSTDLWVLSGWIPEQVFLERFDTLARSFAYMLTDVELTQQCFLYADHVVSHLRGIQQWRCSGHTGDWGDVSHSRARDRPR